MATSKYLQGVTIIDGDFEVACKDAKKVILYLSTVRMHH